ncbi:hypothetical protein WJX74_004458 [Apatococcus lobatus]|uniref:Uncharacterized protein n=1 Tax=Apatococcus lobatus TaxID=904363 RepID=A0AAW1RC47_9CHLO
MALKNLLFQGSQNMAGIFKFSSRQQAPSHERVHSPSSGGPTTPGSPDFGSQANGPFMADGRASSEDSRSGFLDSEEPFSPGQPAAMPPVPSSGFLHADEWEAFVADNWSIMLEQAFGACWRHHFANDVTAILHLTMQQSCLADPTLFSNWAKSALPIKLTMTPTSAKPPQDASPTAAGSTHSTHSDHPRGSDADGHSQTTPAADCNGHPSTSADSPSETCSEPASESGVAGGDAPNPEAGLQAGGKRKAAGDQSGLRGLQEPAQGYGAAMGVPGNNIIHPLDQAVSSLQQLGAAASSLGLPTTHSQPHPMYPQSGFSPGQAPAPISLLTHLANPLFHSHFGMAPAAPAPQGSLFGESGLASPYSQAPMYATSGQTMTPTQASPNLQASESFSGDAAVPSPRAPPRHFKSPGSTRTRRPVRILRPLRNPPQGGPYSDPFRPPKMLPGSGSSVDDPGSPASDPSNDAATEEANGGGATNPQPAGTHSQQAAQNGLPATHPPKPPHPPAFQFGASQMSSRALAAGPMRGSPQGGSHPRGFSGVSSRSPLGPGPETSPADGMVGSQQRAGGWLPPPMQPPGVPQSGAAPGWGNGVPARRISSGGGGPTKNKKRSAPALDAPTLPRQIHHADPSSEASDGGSTDLDTPSEAAAVAESHSDLYTQQQEYVNGDLEDPYESPPGLSPVVTMTPNVQLQQAAAVGTAAHGASQAHPFPLQLPYCRNALEGLDMTGRSPLHVAAAAGRADVVKHLLYAGCNSSKWLPADYRVAHLQSAAEVRDMMTGGAASGRLLLPTCPPIQPIWDGDAATPDSMMPPVSFQHATPLHLAAYRGHAVVVEMLLHYSGGDIRCKNAQGLTSLHMAAHQGHAEVVSRLCRVPGNEIDAIDGQGRTALHHAAALGHDDVMMELWARGCSIEPADLAGWTALHHAAEAGHVEVVAKLVIAGSHVQRMTVSGYTAAHLAARHGFHGVVDKLLLAGYPIDLLGAAIPGSAAASSVLHLAAHNGHLEMVDKLLMTGASPGLQDYRGCNALHSAAQGGHSSVFARLHEAGAPLDEVDADGASVLHHAAEGGNIHILSWLLQEGSCDPSTKTAAGCTILHYAARSGVLAVVERLMKTGCRLHEPDDMGVTPWHTACEAGNRELVSFLLARGCSVDSCTDDGSSALHFAARSGELRVVELLLEEGADPDLEDEAGQTPLHWAACVGHAAVIAKLMADHGSPSAAANKRDAQGWTPLHHAANHGARAAVVALLQAGSDADATTLQGLTALHLAVRGRCGTAAQALLSSGAAVGLADCNGSTALHFAVQLGDSGLFNAISAQPGSELGVADKQGHTLLHYAVEGGSLAIVGALLFSGFMEPPEPPSPGTYVFTPLHLAAKLGRLELLPLLLKAGFWPGTVDPCGRTSLHHAAMSGLPPACEAVPAGPARMGLQQPPTAAPVPAALPDHHHAAELLLSAGGLNWHAVDKHGCSALHYAAGAGNLQVLERLLVMGESIFRADINSWTPLMWAAAGGHVAVIQRLLVGGAALGICDKHGQGVLHVCAAKGHLEAVSTLVDALAAQKLDLHSPDRNGNSPAQLAAAEGHISVVARILDSGRQGEEKGLSALHLATQAGVIPLVRQLLALPHCDRNAQDADGLTPLHWAASKGAGGILDLLIAKGANVNITSHDGWTPLHEAATNGHVSAVKALIKAGVQVHAKTSNGLTALHNAASAGHMAVVQQLLEAGSSINARTASGTNALYNAATAGHVEAVQRLIDAGSELDVQAANGLTVLHSAASNGHCEVIEELIKAGCDLDIQAQNGCTGLHNAAANGHLATAKALINAACDLDIQNSNGNTALHVAASKGHAEVVEALLEAGADPHIKNSKSWMAVHSAAACGHFEVVLQLVKHGASWRARADCDVIKLLCRKTSYKHSYVEGRLRLAEKERQRLVKGKTGPPATAVVVGPSDEELKQLKAIADANMAALLEEEEVKKEEQEKRRSRKREKRKKKGAKPGDDGSDEEDAFDSGDALSESAGNSLSVSETPQPGSKPEPASSAASAVPVSAAAEAAPKEAARKAVPLQEDTNRQRPHTAKQTGVAPVKEQLHPTAAAKSGTEQPAKVRVKTLLTQPSSEMSVPLSNGNNSKTPLPAVSLISAQQDRSESRRRPSGNDSNERSSAAAAASAPRRKQSGSKPAATTTGADSAPPRSSAEHSDRPAQNGPVKRVDAQPTPLPTAIAKALTMRGAEAAIQLPAIQNGPLKRLDSQSASQAPPTGKVPTRGGDAAPAAKQPTPKNGLHPKAAGLVPPTSTQSQPADAAAPPAEHASGQRQVGPNKVGRSTPSQQPTSNGQRRGPPDNNTAEADRPATPAASFKSPLANGSRTMPGSKGGNGVGSPAKGGSRQSNRGTANGNVPAQNPWQIRAQQRESAVVHGMQRMRLSNSESHRQGGDPGTSAWPALGTSPGGTPFPPEIPTHSNPLQPPATSSSYLGVADRSRSAAAQSQGLPHDFLPHSSERSLADGLLQQLNLDGGSSSLQHMPNGLLRSSPSTHPMQQQPASAAPGWQPLLGRAGFDWSLGMASAESPLGGSFTDASHGMPLRHEGGFSTMAAPLVPALDDSSLQQHARSQPIQSMHPPTSHSLLASQLSSSGGSGGLLREASAARPVPLSPLRTHLTPLGGSPMGPPRTHSSLGSADMPSSGGLKGALRSPGSNLGSDTRLLAQSSSPLRSGSQPHGGLVGSILGPANGQQAAQAMPDNIRQIWERGSGGSASSGLDSQTPRLDPRLASPIMEPSMWQPQGAQPHRPSFGQRGVAAALQSFSHASR